MFVQRRRLLSGGSAEIRRTAPAGCTHSAEVIGILNSAGTLGQLRSFKGLARAEADVERLRQRHDAAEAVESGSLKLSVAGARLQERLHEDYSEQEAVVDKAILTFRKISVRALRRFEGRELTISPTDNGPAFENRDTGLQERGRSNLQIFCFDMMLDCSSLEQGRSQLPRPRCASYCSTGLTSGRWARPWRSERSCAT